MLDGRSAECVDWTGVVLNMHASWVWCGTGVLDGCGAR